MLVAAAGELPPPEQMASANGGGGPVGHGGVSVTRRKWSRFGCSMVSSRRTSASHELALEAGQDYSLEVWIGVLTSESITRPGAPAFPDAELPEGPNRNRGGLRLRPERGRNPKGHRGHSRWPGTPTGHPSHSYSHDPGPVFGRIALYFEGRGAANCHLPGRRRRQPPFQAGKARDRGRDDRTSQPGRLVRAARIRCGHRRQPKRCRRQGGDRDPKGRASRCDRLTGCEPRIEQLIGVLTAVADDPDAFKSLTSESSLDLLFDAATIGEELHQTFVSDHGIPDRFFALGRVQIISATPESYLPVELFYALQPPTVPRACARTGRRSSWRGPARLVKHVVRRATSRSASPASGASAT